MDRKIRVRVFDNRAKKFVELGSFPDTALDGVAVRGAIFYENLDPAVLSLYPILDIDCEERDQAEFEYSDFSFSQFTGKYDDNQMVMVLAKYYLMMITPLLKCLSLTAKF